MGEEGRGKEVAHVLECAFERRLELFETSREKNLDGEGKRTAAVSSGRMVFPAELSFGDSQRDKAKGEKWTLSVR